MIVACGRGGVAGRVTFVEENDVRWSSLDRSSFNKSWFHKSRFNKSCSQRREHSLPVPYTHLDRANKLAGGVGSRRPWSGDVDFPRLGDQQRVCF